MLRQKCLLSRMDIPYTNTYIINLFLLRFFLLRFFLLILTLSYFLNFTLPLSIFRSLSIRHLHTHTHTHTHTFRLLSLAPSSAFYPSHPLPTYHQFMITLSFTISLSYLDAFPRPSLSLSSLALATLRYKVPPTRDVCCGDSRRRISRFSVFWLYS